MRDLIDDVCEAIRDPRLEFEINERGEIRALVLKPPFVTSPLALCPITALAWLRRGIYYTEDQVQRAATALGYSPQLGNLLDSSQLVDLIATAADDPDADPRTERGRLRRQMLEALQARTQRGI